MKTLAPPPKLMFLDASGAPAVDHLLYTYAAGSTTPLATFTDSTGNSQNTNPIVLNARGEASVWLSMVLYKFVFKTPGGSTIWTVDNIGGFSTVGSATQYESWEIAGSDETTAITAGVAKITIPYWPFDMAVTEVIAGLTTAQSSGSIVTFDINDDSVSILSTKLTINNTETTSATAATPPVIVSNTIILKGSRVTFDYDQVGGSTAAGVKFVINGYRS